jgi:16S rRNA (uracil1498-N3)-methyltransferase
MSPRVPGAAAERRLFLARNPAEGRPELHEDELDHALRVLRLVPGDTLVGVDGRGRAWRLRVASVARRTVELDTLELAGEESVPGSGPAAAPWVTCCVSLPRPGPTEELIDRLVQLGVGAIVPLVTSRSGPHAREFGGARRVRCERIAREALKQSGRLWLPRIEAPSTLEELGDALAHGRALPGEEPSASGDDGRVARAVLAPDAEHAFLAWAEARRTEGVRAWTVIVGPEGGFEPRELDLLAARGVAAGRIARHVLRVETAAEAALSVLAALDVRG